ncbi:EpsG family protein [Klebsiella pneumoniae]|uniref:EpsG family protein n=1 Tax=Klebsiella pneumoniae complex TaxID=3390273 RepID=UPI0007CA2FE3|nr:EpsG family protein [Klebsiella pneumoniae]SAR59925.1 Uncharacterised protein [Klebsiella pneumoniae]
MIFNKTQKNGGVFFFIVVSYIISVVSFMFSPLLGFYLSLIFLSFQIKSYSLTRLPLVMIILLSAAYIVSSREILVALGDDLQVYNVAYESIEHGGTIFYKDFSGGFEFLLMIFFWLCYHMLGIAEPASYIFVFCFLCLSLFYIWMEKFIIPDITPNKRSLCLASSIGFFVIFSTSQTMRQMLGTIFIIYALMYYRQDMRGKFILFSLAAVFSHLTSLIIIPMFLFLMSDSKTNKNIVIAISLMVSVSFYTLLPFIISHSLLGAATYKLNYYQATSLSGSSFDSFFKLLIVMWFLSYFFYSKDMSIKCWKSLLIYGGVVYICWMPIPLASDRLLYPLTNVLLGLVMFFCFSRITIVYRIILPLFFIVKICSLGPGYDGGILDGMSLWHKYEWIGFSPFYFISL